MIFVHFPSYLTKLLPNYVFLDCTVHKDFRKKKYKIVIVKTHGLFLFSGFYLLM